MKQRGAELTHSSEALYETRVLRKTDYCQTPKKLSGKEYDNWEGNLEFWSDGIGPTLAGQSMGTLRKQRQCAAVRTCRSGKDRR